MDKFFSFPKPPIFFTNRKKIDNFAPIIEKLPESSAIIIREYDLSALDREIFAQKIIDLASGKSLKILIGKDITLAKKLKADGVHFSDLDFPANFNEMDPRLRGDDRKESGDDRKESGDDRKESGDDRKEGVDDKAQGVKGKKKNKNLILSFATHSIAGIDLAIELKADIIFIAPAFATSSHLDTEPLGEIKLREIALKYKNLNYLCALGGINANNINLIKSLGFASFGAIDFFKNL